MGGRFKKITYDLSQNLITDREKAVDLKHAALVLTIAYHLRKVDLVEEFRNINFDDDSYLSNSQVKSFIDHFVIEIDNSMPEYHDSTLKALYPYVRSTIRSVIEEVISYFKNFNIYSMKEMHLFLKYVVLNPDGTVNPKQTVLRIFEREQLPAKTGFKMASKFFLKDEAVEYYSRLSLSEKQRHWQCGKNIQEDIERYFIYATVEHFQSFVNFLEYCISKYGGGIKCRKEIRRFGMITKHFFRRAVELNNEMAVQYIWINFISQTSSKEMLMEEIISTYVEKHTHSNIVMYLILQADELELENLFNNKGCKIMKLVYYNKRWLRLYFKILKELGRHFIYSEYSDLLYDIVSSYENKNSCDIDVQFLKKFFSQIPDGARDMLTEQESSWKIYYQLLRAPFELADFDSATTFLGYSSKRIIFYFLLSPYGMNLLESSIKSCKFDFTNNILKKYLNDSKINGVKRMFFKFKASQLFYSILYLGTGKMDILINWFSDSVDEKDIKEFKSKFPYESEGIIVKTLLFPLKKEHTRLLYTKKILDWCEGKKHIGKVKSLISLHLEEESSDSSRIKCYKNVYELILQSDWKFLKKLITWTKCNTLDKHILGRKLLVDPSLFVDMQKNENVFNYFYKFSKWVIKHLLIKEGDDEMRAFKLNIFNKIELFQPLVRKLDLDEMKDAISWCKPPVAEARRFKKSISCILDSNKPNTVDKQKKFHEFVEWFNSYINNYC